MISLKVQFSSVLLISLFLAGCRGASAGEDATALDAGDAPEGEPAVDASSPQTLNLDAQGAFSELPGNYTVAMDYRFTGIHADGSPVVSSWRLDGVGQADPPASRYTFSGEGAANINGSAIFEVTYIGDQSYFYTSEIGCVNMTVGDAVSPFDSMVDTGGMLANQVQRVLPDETINGVLAHHYDITADNIDPADPAAMSMSEFTQGDMYVAASGGYVLRLVLEGRGSSSLLSGDETLEGDIFYQLDFTPAVSVGEITPPEGCAGATESEFPVMADASNQSSFQGFLSYQSAGDLQTIVDFYKAEMGALGWSMIDENMMANIGMLRFDMGDRTVSVVVTFDASSSLSNVIVGEE